MTDKAGKTPRESVRERLARLGFKYDPACSSPRRVVRTVRYRRELDEITFSKPYKPDTDKSK
jgi:hypothetical protein